MHSACARAAHRLGIRSEQGVTAIEYGLIAGLVAIVIVTAVGLVGTNLSGLFTYIAGKITTPGS
jgi:pilus assembly protein Flp/PilA